MPNTSTDQIAMTADSNQSPQTDEECWGREIVSLAGANNDVRDGAAGRPGDRQ
jgi:hypothetical protein